MSIVYRYYIGYVEDGKAYPLGPYDDFGTFCPVVRRSGSSASRLHEKFRTLPEDMAGAQLLSMFGHEDVFGKHGAHLRYLPLADLPDGNYVKHGYFLRSDVQEYIATGEADGLFYRRLDPEVLAARLRTEAAMGAPARTDDDVGEPPASAYMYYAYEDYACEEYDAFLLRQVAAMLVDGAGDGPLETVVLLDVR